MMNFVFEQHKTGGDRNFGYLLGDRKAQVAALIDPSYAPELLCERAIKQGMDVTWILNTHLHHDHTNGNEAVKKLFPKAKIGAFAQAEEILKEGSEIMIGQFPLHVIHVPGHCPDHLVFYQPTFGIAFTGDHLFVGKVGGTGSEEAAKQQFDSLKRLINDLPPDTTIWPGHDVGCRPSSTLALEKATNPFLLADDIIKFNKLKQEWPSYKAAHGLL